MKKGLFSVVIVILFIVLVTLVGGVYYLRSNNIQLPNIPTVPSKVEIISMYPVSGTVGTIITFKGKGFTNRGNFIKFEEGYSEPLNSPDNETLIFIIPDNIRSGCGYPYLSESPGTARCEAFSNIPLTAGAHNISVANTNGESNTINLEILSK